MKTEIFALRGKSSIPADGSPATIPYKELTMKSMEDNIVINLEGNTKFNNKNVLHTAVLQKNDIIVPCRTADKTKIFLFDFDTDEKYSVNHQYIIIRTVKGDWRDTFLTLLEDFTSYGKYSEKDNLFILSSQKIKNMIPTEHSEYDKEKVSNLINSSKLLKQMKKELNVGFVTQS